MNHFILLLGVLVATCLSCTVASQSPSADEELPLLDQIYLESSVWVDSTMSTLTEEQKIAQLFWLSVSYPKGVSGYNPLRNLIEEYQPGGLLLMRMKVEEAYDVISDLQSISPIPLLVSVDGETGLYMRMREVVPFPEAMTLGAIADDSLIYRMGREMARHMNAIGIHVNMAPVADVNSNPNNPVIGMRSFGEDPVNVSKKSVAYMKGLQDGRIMAVGKHFPGHGDTSSDSHYTLPVVNRSKEDLDSVELKPFKELIDHGIWGVMTAHMHLPMLDSVGGIPTSFSKLFIKDILRDELKFTGLVITDAMNMQGAKFMGKPGVIDALALAAGNDVVEFTEDLPKAIASVKLAIKDSLMTWEDINEKCRRSLAFKYWLIKTNTSKKVLKQNLLATINNQGAKDLNQALYDAALTVLAYDENIPRTPEFLKDSITIVVVGESGKYSSTSTAGLTSSIYYVSTTSEWESVRKKLNKQKRSVIVISNSSWAIRRENNTLTSKVIQYSLQKPSTVVFMGNPYHLPYWKGVEKSKSLIVTYQNREEAFSSALKFLSGEIGSSGRLPVSIDNIFTLEDGLLIE